MFGVAWPLNVEQALFDFVGHNSQSLHRPSISTVIRDCTETTQHLTVEEGLICHGEPPPALLAPKSQPHDALRHAGGQGSEITYMGQFLKAACVGQRDNAGGGIVDRRHLGTP